MEKVRYGGIMSKDAGRYACTFSFYGEVNIWNPHQLLRTVLEVSSGISKLKRLSLPFS